MYKLKFRHFIFLLILESPIVNTTESLPSSETLLNIPLFVFLPIGLVIVACVVFTFYKLTLYLKIYKLIRILRKRLIRSRHDSSTETVPLVPNTIVKLVHCLPKQTLTRAGERDPFIRGMSYNSARDELFLADRSNGVVRAMRVRDNAGDMRDVYRAPHDKYPFVYSVCHMSDSDTLLVCSSEYGPDQKVAKWLVALSRNFSEWREAQRVQTDREGWISCALSDSRVLIGFEYSTYMEVFRVESGPRIARVHRIDVPEIYEWFSAKCGIDTLVAISYRKDQSVRVHRLIGDQQEELSRIHLKSPYYLLWLADRLLVDDSNAVIELEVSDTRLERRRELIATSEKISVYRLCAVNDGFAIFDSNSRHILHYSFA